MSLSADDDFLDVVAHQARVTYATQQLNICRTALQRWQAHPADEVGAYDHARVQHELVYYTQQVNRWLDYLASLGQMPYVRWSTSALMVLVVPSDG